ncbi:MAG: hypothetical protein PWQ57_2269 [Desulfovibrionales bacterium]|nr:hypothetical protein [Desulfovibrionales bacterium]
MPNNTLLNAWERLPESVKTPLRIGSCGQPHLLEAARAASETGEEDLWRDLLLSACAESPVNGDLAMQLFGLVEQRGWGSPELLQALRGVAAEWRKPGNLDYFLRLAAKRDTLKIQNFLDKQLSRPPASLFWISQALLQTVVAYDPQRALHLLERFSELSPLLDKPRADMLAFLGRFDEAKEVYARIGALFGEAQQCLWLGQLALHAGDRDRGAGLLARALLLQPWRTSLAFRLDDLLHGRDEEVCDPPGATAVCLYTFNKAEELRATLDSLSRCRLEGARVFVLDNGATDHTAQVLDSFSDRFGDLFHRIDLPVNVGAAAARNWLASIEEVAACDFVCYMDDDITLPPDFLGRLGAAVRCYPDAFVYGCKVCDDAAPPCLQAVDYHLRRPGQPQEPEQPPRIEPWKPHLQILDMGQFDYLRPCVSTTGCLHLFPASTLRRSGGFSIQLSPSQYDDFEHDLRLGLKGGFAAYQGSLRILHKKRTGMAGHVDRQQLGNALGNKLKVEWTHAESDMAGLIQQDEQRLEADLRERFARLDEMIGEVGEASL